MLKKIKKSLIFKPVKKLNETPPSATEYNNLSKLITLIKNNTNVFIIGQNGTGKTFLINQAIKNIKDRKCYYFDINQLIVSGGRLKFYQKIVQDLIGKSIPYDKIEIYILEEFFNDLIKEINSPVVLFFDHFRVFNDEFYQHFFNTCRKIDSVTYSNTVFSNDSKKPETKSKYQNIVMVFSGSLVISDKSDLSKSPLWNITEKIFVRPHSRLEANLNNYRRLTDLLKSPPETKLLDIIYNLTSGHKFLSKTLIQIIIAYDMINKSEDEILDKYIHHIWSVINTKKELLDTGNKKIWFHFHNIIEYFETNASILMAALNLNQNRQIYSESPFEMDQITITGIIDKKDDGEYFFSNDIYRLLMAILFDNYRAGDYCLFHTEDDLVWKRTKEIYQSLHDSIIRRKYTRMITTKSQTSAYIANNIIQRLKKNKDIKELTKEISEILTLMYDISEWAIYIFQDIDSDQIKLDENFSQLGNRIQISEPVKRFFYKIVIEKKQLNDWTGTWQGIPIIIGNTFKRLFVYRLQPGKRGWGRIIPTFIKDAMNLYHNLIEQKQIKDEFGKLHKTLQEKEDEFGKLSKILKEYDSMTIQASDTYKNTEQQYWRLSKQFLFSIKIKDFIFYEILYGNKVRLTHSKEDKLSSYDKLQDLDQFNHLKDFQNIFQYKQNGQINEKLYYGKQLTGCTMSIPGNMMIIETNLTEDKYKIIKKNFFRYIRLIYFALEQNIHLYQTSKRLIAAQNVLNVSQNLIFIVSKDNEIVFVNQKLSHLLNINNEDLKDLNTLNSLQSIYKQDTIKMVLEKKQIIFEEIKFNVNKKEKITNATYIPLIKNNNVFAVSIIMQEVTYRNKLLIANQNMLKAKTTKEVEQILLNQFSSLGFTIVIQYKKQHDSDNKYISEAVVGINTKKQYEYQIEFTNNIGINVWYRKGFPINDNKHLWINRLNQSSEFKLKEDQYWPSYDKKKTNRPNFWITFPIRNFKNDVVKFYSMGWITDDEWDNEYVNDGKLTLLNSFAITASQIIENIKPKEYLEKFQGMISHGLKEPFYVALQYLEPLPKMKYEEQLEMTDIVCANIEMGLTGLQSLLTLRRGKSLEKEIIELNDILQKQTRLFEAYARKKSNINFTINYSHTPIYFLINKVMLIQVLNNLIGNSINYIKRAQLKREKKIQVELKKTSDEIVFYISDNGKGLPKDVKDYLKQDVSIGHQICIKQFGIKFSREIAHLLGGRLELIDLPLLGQGTSYQLIFPCKEGNHNDT